MLVKPPMETQPQEIVENPPIQSVNEVENGKIIENNGEISAYHAPSLTNQTPQDNKAILIRKKREYKAFLRLIKQGKYTSAQITSKLLGVDRSTILEWLHTPMVLQCMNEEVEGYVSKISSSKDWKAQAYLLDKVIDNDSKSEQSNTTLTNLIQINI